MLSECAILPFGLIMDYIGPQLFCLVIFIMHVGGALATANLSSNSPWLFITFFCMGSSAQACSLLAMRTVYIFDCPRARKRWLFLCCTVFDSSALCTMVFFDLWKVHMMHAKEMFWIIAAGGGILFGAQFTLWMGFTCSKSMEKKSVLLTEEDYLLDKLQLQEIGEIEESIELSKNVQEEGETLLEIFTGYKFYFFVLMCAVNIYRVRYFLGIAGYSLKYLNDTGTYLELLGYCFSLSIVLGPLSEKVLFTFDNDYKSLHLVNITVTTFFLTWLIPSLEVQVVTFILFIVARLLCFAVLSEYCSKEYSQKRFGLVLGFGFFAASVPGAFTFGIVDVVQEKFNGNFWIFHVVCILMSVPVSVLIYFVHKNSELNSHIETMPYMSI